MTCRFSGFAANMDLFSNVEVTIK